MPFQDNLFREQNVSILVGENGILGGIHCQIHVEAAGREEILLGEILAVDLMLVAHGLSEFDTMMLEGRDAVRLFTDCCCLRLH